MNRKAQEHLATMSDDEIATIYRNKFQDWGGQLLLEHLKMGSNFYKPSFDEEVIDPCMDKRCIFNEGKRSVVLSIETFIRMQPQQEAPKEV